MYPPGQTGLGSRISGQMDKPGTVPAGWAPTAGPCLPTHTSSRGEGPAWGPVSPSAPHGTCVSSAVKGGAQNPLAPLPSEALGPLLRGWQARRLCLRPQRCQHHLWQVGQGPAWSCSSGGRGLVPRAPSYVGAQLCALLVGDVGGQRVYDVEQQLLTQ